MKNLIVLILFSLLFSCAGRKSNVEINSEKKTEKESGSVVEKNVINSDLSKITNNETSTAAVISEEKKETTKQEEVKEVTSEKASSENSGKSLKRKTYYENGNVKSETDYTENFSKIESENENLKSKISTQNEIITDLKSSNTSLQRISENQKSTIASERNLNAKYKKEVSELKKSKNKETEREAYPWYWIVLGTILIWELLKLATKKYRGKFLESFNSPRK